MDAKSTYTKLVNAFGAGTVGILLAVAFYVVISEALYRLSLPNQLHGRLFGLLIIVSFCAGFALYLWNARGRAVEPGVVLWPSKRKIRILGVEFTAWVLWFAVLGFAIAMLFARWFGV